MSGSARRGWRRFSAGVFRGIEWLAVLLLTAMVLVVSVQIFSRLLLNRTPEWSEELAQVLTIWFGFLGAGLLVRTRGHIALEFFVSRLPTRGQKIAQAASAVLMAGFALYMLCWGGMLAGRFVTQTLPGTGLPVAFSYLPIPISGALILLALIDAEKPGEERGER